MNLKLSSRIDLTEKAAAKIELLRRNSIRYGFKWFVNNVFRLSFDGNYVGGQYIDNVCDRMTDNLYTMDITGRDHFKSTRVYAEIMFHIFTETKPWDAFYLSFSSSMAKHHLMKINEFIEQNPAFKLMHNHKTNAEFMLIYSWDKHAPKMVIKPKGMFEYKRGIHAQAIYVDDPFKDVEENQELDPKTIYKVNEVMISQLLPMVKKNGICRVVGTPQTDEDFFFDKAMQKEFKTTIAPAIVSREKKIAIWPEWYSYDQLIAKENIQGKRRFSREYMARPLRGSNSYIDQEQYEDAATNTSWKLKDYSDLLKGKYIVGGFDIGKKVHPSHLALFIRTFIQRENEEGETVRVPMYRQIFSMWFDKVKYNSQIETLNQICEWFNVSYLAYDNTRSEFESYAENGDLHSCMTPVVFTAKQKNIMATTLEHLFDTNRIVVVDEDRQLKQFLSVNANLDAPETSLGHGDAFWSIGLAVTNDDNMPNVRNVRGR